ncbi:hypothetical protein HNY73_004388 [Argiope bruennichi]|uniref:Uncharacterized protein n=1 Tax=Argiope bruennichi TaxID=94029 RepID=A0A8T0FRQ5_ARGBR|nr:hypothetical protein HNY73_004388 [Argiope bruennichi]
MRGYLNPESYECSTYDKGKLPKLSQLLNTNVLPGRMLSKIQIANPIRNKQINLEGDTTFFPIKDRVLQQFVKSVFFTGSGIPENQIPFQIFGALASELPFEIASLIKHLPSADGSDMPVP